MSDQPTMPLQDLRVIELAGGRAECCGRILADLGADVVLIEPPGGGAGRCRPPLHEGLSLHYSAHHANKVTVELDLRQPTAQDTFLELVSGCDALIDNLDPGELDRLGLGRARLLQHQPQLIHLTISDFGHTGPYRDFRGGGPIYTSLAGVLARSGIEGREPLQPPGFMAEEAAAVQATWVLLLSLLKRNRDGLPNQLDYSLFEATAQLIDPGLGVTGSAAGGRTAAELAKRGRPQRNPLYPIFPCQDGHVRICVLNPRQWQSMSEWLGPDHPFTDPKFGQLDARGKVIDEINALIAQLFADLPGNELVAEGQRRGVPIARLASPADVLADEHFRTRGSFRDWQLGDGNTGRIASGYLELDGRRFGPRELPCGQTVGTVLARWPMRPPPAVLNPSLESYRPLSGLRVLDLGVIVAGAELGRLLADQGAEVIKVETSAYPDGLRQSYRQEAVSASFAQGCRGKLSFGLNLRNAKGKALFLDLVRSADIVLSNFKPGTMKSLGIDFQTLSSINPRIIVADSSALGNSGPSSKSLGYGPLVRASTGLSGLWRYPDDAHGGFSDGVTIYPDHFAARVSAVGIAAKLYQREHSGLGGTVSVSQAECILNAMATDFLRESLDQGSLRPRGNAGEFDAPSGVFPCAGADEWCAIHVNSDSEFAGLCSAIGRPDLLQDPAYATPEKRIANRGALDALLTNWTSERHPERVMLELQAAGVPAGQMLRVEELDRDAQLLSRLFFRRLVQPELPAPLLTTNGPVSSGMLPDPEIRPAPRFGQHTRALAKALLNLDDDAVEAYFRDGVLEGE